MDAQPRQLRRPAFVAAVQHAIEILRGLSAAARPLGVSELARMVGLHKSSVSRLLVTLEQAHLVERDQFSNKFRPGVGLISLAAPLIANLSLLEIATPVLEATARETGETVSLNVWDGEAAVSILQVPGGNAIKHFAPPGMRNPPHCTAAGKVLLARMPDESISHALDRKLEAYTEKTRVDGSELRTELERIRRDGYAINEGELDVDVGAVASAVHDLEGKVVAAIVTTVPMYRFGKQYQAMLIDVVTSASRTLSQRLGYTGSK